MKESQIREHIEKGWVRAIVTFEIVGKPAKHVEDALKGYMTNIKKDDRIIVLREENERAAKVDEGLFSAFCETDLLFKNLETLTWLAINFSPASIEILAPSELDIPARDVTNWLNDLLANLHEVSSTTRAHKNTADHLTIAINQLILNSILLAAQLGPKTPTELAKATGILPEQILPFLQNLIQKGRLTQQGDRFVFVPLGAVVLKNAPSVVHRNVIGGKRAPVDGAKAKKKQ